MRPGGCPPLHIQTFTLKLQGTQTILQKADTHGLCHSVLRQTNVHIYTHMPYEMNAGSHKLLFVPHQVCKYMSIVYICNLLQSPHLMY